MTLFAETEAWANPILVGPPPLAAYLSSENLLVSISATDAVFKGAFTFEARQRLHPPSGTDLWQNARSLSVDMYIWIPEVSEDPTVGAFWSTFRKGNINLLTPNAAATEVFDRAIGLRIKLGERELRAGNGIEWFLAVPYRPPDSNPETGQFISELMKAMHVPEKPAPPIDEPGFCLLTLGFHDDGTIVRNRTVIEMSYRQPLVCTSGEGRFYYMPVFPNMPKGFSTADTNHYAITFVGLGCTLAITNGTKFTKAESGSSAIFAPQPDEPFRVVSQRAPDPLR